tara:strand:- start:7028 stop:7273 length:246 start_codon:yes stop_codon:yes gene_type:complete
MMDMVVGYNMALAVTRAISKTEFKKLDTHERLEIMRFIDDAISFTYGSAASVKIWREPFEKKLKEFTELHEKMKQKAIKNV